jgi:hypothetical protein
MLALLSSLALASKPVMPLIEEAADEFGIPFDLLAALAWESSRMNPDVVREWGAWGVYDLRAEGDPSTALAAALLEVDSVDVSTDVRTHVRGAAAIVAQQAKQANEGVLPDPGVIEDWWDSVRIFSGSADPVVQKRFNSYVFTVIWQGVDTILPNGEVVRFGGRPVDLPSLTGLPEMVPALPDYDGAVAFVQACDYTNDSRSGSEIDTVVVHTMQGSYSGSISWFQNCASEASAHYMVRSSDGEITQMVAEADIAWHAGWWDVNAASIGIEHEGYLEDPEVWFTSDMYEASADLVKDIITRTSVENDRSHLIGHDEVPGCPYSGGGVGCHTDPGFDWDWDRYMDLIGGTAPVAGTLIGVVAEGDIFTGPRIVGATVTLEETGAVSTSDALGVYRFDGLPEGTYTARASASGYDDGTCTKLVDGSSEYWCSIALEVGGEDPPPGTTAPGTNPGGTGTWSGTEPGTGGTGTDGAPLEGGASPRTPLTSLRSGCNQGGAGAGAWVLAALLAFGFRRRE